MSHLPSIGRWRAASSKGDYNPNIEASRQEMRSFVCAQCHVVLFKGDAKLVVFPWQNELKMEQIESYYDTAAFKDFVHKDSGANVLKAQHPDLRPGVRACTRKAACHAPIATCRFSASGRRRSATIRSAAPC